MKVTFLLSLLVFAKGHFHIIVTLKIRLRWRSDLAYSSALFNGSDELIRCLPSHSDSSESCFHIPTWLFKVWSQDFVCSYNTLTMGSVLNFWRLMACMSGALWCTRSWWSSSFFSGCFIAANHWRMEHPLAALWANYVTVKLACLEWFLRYSA